jgi:hypothetical protein
MVNQGIKKKAKRGTGSIINVTEREFACVCKDEFFHDLGLGIEADNSVDLRYPIEVTGDKPKKPKAGDIDLTILQWDSDILPHALDQLGRSEIKAIGKAMKDQGIIVEMPTRFKKTKWVDRIIDAAILSGWRGAARNKKVEKQLKIEEATISESKITT